MPPPCAGSNPIPSQIPTDAADVARTSLPVQGPAQATTANAAPTHQANFLPRLSANKELEEIQDYQEPKRDGASPNEPQRGDVSLRESTPGACKIELTQEEEQILRGPPVGLPLGDFVQWLFSEWVPPDDNEWQTGFRALRVLKAHPKLRTLPWKKAFAVLEAAITAAYTEDDPWEVAGCLLGNRGETQALFCDQWTKIRIPAGEDLISYADRLAEETPLILSKAVADNRPDDYPRFITLCAWQQVVNGKMPILLGCDFTAQRLGFSRGSTISRYIRFAVEDGFLACLGGAAKGTRGKGGRANAFWFNVGLFEAIRMAAHADIQNEFDKASRP